MQQARRSHRGFTLTELLVTLAIAGILAMAGVPAMGGLLARSRTAGAQASIIATLRHARNAAIMHNARVLVCPSLDARRCAADDNWQRGWIVARDADRDGRPDTGIPVLTTQAAMSGDIRVVTSAGRKRIFFYPNGSAAGSNARFTVCQARERDGKAVVVSNSGRVRLEPADPARLQACLAGLP
ncbi:MAG TPA: GspH/FimT family pseudopilin [Rhodanobacteraceae bacterium]|nr:GspH/FimT family pseudopilin [Rhodanobacteraceae bacterium]